MAPMEQADRTLARRRRVPALAQMAGLFVLLFLAPGLLGPARTLATTTAGSLLQLAVLAAVLRADPAWPRFGLTARWRDAADAPLIAAAALGVLVLASLLVAALPEPVANALLRGERWRLEGLSQAPLAIAFVLLGAYREELYFRAYLLTLLDEIATPPWVAVLAASLLFSAGHLYQGWLAAAVALVLGSGLAVLYRRRRSVHRLAWAHAIFNGTVLALSLFTHQGFATMRSWQ